MAPRSRFDSQARDFDTRAGVGEDAAAAIAAAIVAVASTGATPATILEIGPGTGEIGAHLATAARGGYVGVDVSFPMLEAFARRTPGRVALAQADAARPWPIRTGAVDLIFASRAAHLLDIDHVAAEVTRVTRPGGHVLIGRVQRARHGLRNRLRDHRRALLADHGIDADDGADRSRRLLDTLASAGATPLERRRAAQWSATTSATRLVDQWEAGATIGRRPIPASVHAVVIADLRAWVADQPAASTDDQETYILDGVRLP